MTTILLVGAADTGRAPIAAALLGRLLGPQRALAVESAGVLGHDGDPAETEARDTMLHMGLDIAGHRARSIDDELAASAALLIAIDSGTALVLRGRFPAARVFTLGELAGRKRDVPDPFRMQIGAWMTYARELEELLRAALPRIGALAGAPAAAAPAEPLSAPAVAAERRAAAGRIGQLLQLASQMPDVVDWAAARGRLEGDLGAIAAAPAGPADLAAAYVGVLRAALAMLPTTPSPGQLAAIQASAERLQDPIDQPALTDLAASLATLASRYAPFRTLNHRGTEPLSIGKYLAAVGKEGDNAGHRVARV